jgi:hypothetical protein
MRIASLRAAAVTALHPPEPRAQLFDEILRHPFAVRLPADVSHRIQHAVDAPGIERQNRGARRPSAKHLLHGTGGERTDVAQALRQDQIRTEGSQVLSIDLIQRRARGHLGR